MRQLRYPSLSRSNLRAKAGPLVIKLAAQGHSDPSIQVSTGLEFVSPRQKRFIKCKLASTSQLSGFQKIQTTCHLKKVHQGLIDRILSFRKQPKPWCNDDVVLSFTSSYPCLVMRAKHPCHECRWICWCGTRQALHPWSSLSPKCPQGFDGPGEHEATKPNSVHLIHVQLDLFDLSIPWQSRIPTLESHVCLVLVSRSQGRFCPNSSPSAKCKASSPHSLEHCKMLKCVSHLWMRFYSPPGDTHRLENSLGAHWQKSLMMMCHLTTLKNTPGLTLPAHDPWRPCLWDGQQHSHQQECHHLLSVYFCCRANWRIARRILAWIGRIH